MTQRTRPYFHEHWMGPAKLHRLAEAMAAVTATTGRVIEVGSWEGRSTIAIADFFYPERIVAIDHWQGDEDATSAVNRLAAARDVYADFKANMAAATRGNYEVARMDWRAYPWREPLRFLFIDGTHTFEHVFENIRVARPLMLPGSVMAGDDFSVPQVGRAVTQALGEIVRYPGPGAAIWYKVF